MEGRVFRVTLHRWEMFLIVIFLTDALAENYTLIKGFTAEAANKSKCK